MNVMAYHEETREHKRQNMPQATQSFTLLFFIVRPPADEIYLSLGVINISYLFCCVKKKMRYIYHMSRGTVKRIRWLFATER